MLGPVLSVLTMVSIGVMSGVEIAAQAVAQATVLAIIDSLGLAAARLMPGGGLVWLVVGLVAGLIAIIAQCAMIACMQSCGRFL